MKKYLATLAFASTLVASPAFASCRIHNDTRWDFKVESQAQSGSTSNQLVDSHSTTAIAEGRIKGKDAKSGKTVSGYCKDGDELEIKEDGGVPVLIVK